MRRFATVVLIAWLSACVPTMMFDKPGVPPGGGQNDLTDCQVEALAKVPPDKRVHSTPSMPATTEVSCFGTYYTHCTADTYGGGSSTYTIDRNVGLRDRVVVQCMERKGYTLRK